MAWVDTAAALIKVSAETSRVEIAGFYSRVGAGQFQSQGIAA